MPNVIKIDSMPYDLDQSHKALLRCCCCCCPHRPPAGKLLLLKMPNFMKIDSMPYDPDTTDIEPEVTGQGKTMRVQANDINVIRWRYRCV
jgi:hypothetical protein